MTLLRSNSAPSSANAAADPALRPADGRYSWLPALLSAVLAIALYGVSIGGTYIYDDIDVILHDDRIQNPSEWGRFWTESYNYNVDNLYRPLVSMSYALQWWLHGDRAWAFHLINVLLHASVTACVAEFARRLIGFRAALVAGLLFAAHPIHVEAVANIVGRAELMCGLGMFGAFVLMLRPPTSRRSLAIAGCFVVSVLSKEQGMLIPFLLLILVLLQRKLNPLPPPGDPAEAARQRSATMLLILLLCWLFAGYVVWRESILKFWWDRAFLDWTQNPMATNKLNPFGGSVGADRVLVPIALLGRYVGLLVFPLKLSPDYGSLVIGFHVRAADPYLCIGFASLIAWLVGIAIAWRRRSIIALFSLCGFAMTYALISNLPFLIGTNFGERLMYLPSAFVILIVAACLVRLPTKAMAPLLAAILLLASVKTVTYAARWNDRLSFLQESLAEQPKSIRLYIQLAEEYFNRGDLERAARVNAQGCAVLPNYWDIWVQAAQIAIERGRFDEADADLKRAGELFPSAHVAAWMGRASGARATTQRAASQPTTQR